MPVAKGCSTRDALPHTFDIGVFKSVKRNSATIKHIYNESANIIEGCNVAFDTNAVSIKSKINKFCQFYSGPLMHGSSIFLSWVFISPSGRWDPVAGLPGGGEWQWQCSGGWRGQRWCKFFIQHFRLNEMRLNRKSQDHVFGKREYKHVKCICLIRHCKYSLNTLVIIIFSCFLSGWWRR